MKLLITFVVAAIFQDVSAFSPQKHAFRTRSSLSMTAQKNEGQKEIKVGVIGCGRIGLVHLEAITKAPGVTPVIVSNPTVSKAEKG
jgi:threonine dehydrogenase-like Zn-dependent dehydrogenase